LNANLVLWGILFSSFGMGFFMYGRKQKAVAPLVCGLLLMIYPYFISNTILLVLIGIVLIAIPYFVRY
jgi:predicted membrane protein